MNLNDCQREMGFNCAWGSSRAGKHHQLGHPVSAVELVVFPVIANLVMVTRLLLSIKVLLPASPRDGLL